MKDQTKPRSNQVPDPSPDEIQRMKTEIRQNRPRLRASPPLADGGDYVPKVFHDPSHELWSDSI